jgi:hypothetical protein
MWDLLREKKDLEHLTKLQGCHYRVPEVVAAAEGVGML